MDEIHHSSDKAVDHKRNIGSFSLEYEDSRLFADLPWSVAAFGYDPVLPAMSSSATEKKTLGIKEKLLQTENITYNF